MFIKKVQAIFSGHFPGAYAEKYFRGCLKIFNDNANNIINNYTTAKKIEKTNFLELILIYLIFNDLNKKR